ncbi:MAG TPA: 2-amino-4-hydroxy-6-hydroxymethyldihydropteridine diphosphokinase [Tahibacter sp.]|uniref:2-amino-4-hydroxy-6- hydroxymethyldihydropteridine diphosphokinase n=1 Tax=Tahibacter sp. TaxID=2056211 RepID=UPI002B6ED97B|nr:2-amino-4-hydroxy-6-hydroxymethyldihydropteridine diphosphokinase [Tahibacter sp.]HSX61212.1 2-amino-4-hydroxy-6-hydroxymethyldihydropteridine diphosphokinase [Tahibacter sp.]
MTRAFIGLGSNLGDSRLAVAQAARRIGALPNTRLVRSSSHYLTPPWGLHEQPAFINSVVEIDTSLDPRALLDELLRIERDAGRVRDGARWGPRALDLDILLYGEDIICAAALRVPHPYLAQRAFVLAPLAEIASECVVPGQGRVADLLARIDAGECRRLESLPETEPSA